MDSSLSLVIPPLSLVRVVKVTSNKPDWTGYEGRVFRIGYYRRNDGLDCVWLVDDDGQYLEAIDQAMDQNPFRDAAPKRRVRSPLSR